MWLFGKKKKAEIAPAQKQTPAPEGELDFLSGEGLVRFVASNLKKPTPENILKGLDTLARPADDLEHLTEEGELPWGWHTHTKEFTEKINNEYAYFLNNWVEARKVGAIEEYAALKSFVLFLGDAERLCKSKGECFEFWFREILASPDYIETRKTELKYLEDNKDRLFAEENRRNQALEDLGGLVVELIDNRPGILQTEIYKSFDPVVKNDIAALLYRWEQDGIIQRVKQGKTYAVTLK